jgi:hypothetical protein
MQDTSKTRINPKAVTSYAPDKDVNYSTVTAWPTIRLTIGSVMLILSYNTVELRDDDIARLDASIYG